MILKHCVRLQTRAVLTGLSREAALDVVRRWAVGQPLKASVCGLYGGPTRPSRENIDP